MNWYGVMRNPLVPSRHALDNDHEIMPSLRTSKRFKQIAGLVT